MEMAYVAVLTEDTDYHFTTSIYLGKTGEWSSHFSCSLHRPNLVTWAKSGVLHPSNIWVSPCQETIPFEFPKNEMEDGRD